MTPVEATDRRARRRSSTPSAWLRSTPQASTAAPPVDTLSSSTAASVACNLAVEVSGPCPVTSVPPAGPGTPPTRHRASPTGSCGRSSSSTGGNTPSSGSVREVGRPAWTVSSRWSGASTAVPYAGRPRVGGGAQRVAPHDERRRRGRVGQFGEHAEEPVRGAGAGHHGNRVAGGRRRAAESEPLGDQAGLGPQVRTRADGGDVADRGAGPGHHGTPVAGGEGDASGVARWVDAGRGPPDPGSGGGQRLDRGGGSGARSRDGHRFPADAGPGRGGVGGDRGQPGGDGGWRHRGRSAGVGGGMGMPGAGPVLRHPDQQVVFPEQVGQPVQVEGDGRARRQVAQVVCGPAGREAPGEQLPEPPQLWRAVQGEAGVPGP